MDPEAAVTDTFQRGGLCSRAETSAGRDSLGALMKGAAEAGDSSYFMTSGVSVQQTPKEAAERGQGIWSVGKREMSEEWK